MKLSLIFSVLFALGSFTSIGAYADSLSDISEFSKEICDDIQANGNRSITKTEVEAKLQGSMGKIAKYIGVNVGADGKLTIGDTKEEYEGLPYESIAEQMSDSRSCKLEISKILIAERKKVAERLDSTQLSLREIEIREISKEYQELKKKFVAFADKNGEVDVTRSLPSGVFDKDSYGKHVKGKLEVMGGQMQSMLLMMSFVPTLQEVAEGTKNITRSLESVSGYEISQNDEYISLKRETNALGQRSQAVLFEIIDLTKNRSR